MALSLKTAAPARVVHSALGRVLAFPEIEGAVVAVRELIHFLANDCTIPPFNPLFVHGPPGTGKSLLIDALCQQVERDKRLAVVRLSARDVRLAPSAAQHADLPPALEQLGEQAGEAGLFILEDVQHLPIPAVEPLVQLIDRRLSEQRPSVFTARMGPRHLARGDTPYSARLTARLAGGLVVGIDPLGPVSRLAFLEDLARRRQLAVAPEILAWLAEHLVGGGRQLEGAVRQLETLARLDARPLALAGVAKHFETQVAAARPTLERIIERVGAYYRVAAGDLQSSRRQRGLVLPRQVGMYLARQLTKLSLQQIGSRFGGRDHTTVLHACRKMEEALRGDAALSGVVRHLQAELA